VVPERSDQDKAAWISTNTSQTVIAHARVKNMFLNCCLNCYFKQTFTYSKYCYHYYDKIPVLPIATMARKRKTPPPSVFTYHVNQNWISKTFL